MDLDLSDVDGLSVLAGCPLLLRCSGLLRLP